MKRLVVLCTAVLLCVGCSQQSVQPVVFDSATLTVHGAVFSVEVADTEAEREQGLQNRDTLAANAGMVFVFPEKGRHEFWMKNTLVPLDLLWVADGTVLQITSNAKPQLGVSDAALTRYIADVSVNEVVELPAGTAATTSILVGDSVVLRQP